MNAYTSQHVKRIAKQLANPKYIRKQCKWVIITAATSCLLANIRIPGGKPNSHTLISSRNGHQRLTRCPNVSSLVSE